MVNHEKVGAFADEFFSKSWYSDDVNRTVHYAAQALAVIALGLLAQLRRSAKHLTGSSVGCGSPLPVVTQRWMLEWEI
jgi:hypothetical protein